MSIRCIGPLKVTGMFFQGHCFEKDLENKASSIFLQLPKQI